MRRCFQLMPLRRNSSSCSYCCLSQIGTIKRRSDCEILDRLRRPTKANQPDRQTDRQTELRSSCLPAQMAHHSSGDPFENATSNYGASLLVPPTRSLLPLTTTNYPLKAASINARERSARHYPLHPAAQLSIYNRNRLLLMQSSGLVQCWAS